MACTSIIIIKLYKPHDSVIFAQNVTSDSTRKDNLCLTVGGRKVESPLTQTATNGLHFSGHGSL